MQKHLLGFLLMIGCANAAYSQTDTTRTLKEVEIKAFRDTVLISTNDPAITSVRQDFSLQHERSLVPALNTLTGVRAEERSPGSYRLSIRGSLLRSPFGVRNVKIYYDDVPLTDAGGNTYLNALDIQSLSSIEVLKGPNGSLFGANTGGVVLISSRQPNDLMLANIGLNAGSYGQFHQNVGFAKDWGKYGLSVNQGYQSFGGYRDHSYMYRHFVNTTNTFNYGKSNSIRALAFYSDLGYQTPGGLNQAQLDANPRGSRPATPATPSAVAQQAGIYQKMFLGGLVNTLQLNNRIKNVSALFGNHVDFSNPFITNYEDRDEDTYGLRSYFELASEKYATVDWKLNLGLEWQQTNSLISNHDNNGGTRGHVQAIDKLNTNQHFFFTRYQVTFDKRFTAEAALSLNYFKLRFKNIAPAPEANFSERTFDPQLMPRLALNYAFTNDINWKASVSRGYSTPTNLEVRPSNNQINTTLNPQTGWNYETGLTVDNLLERFTIDFTTFYYRLQNAIVSRRQADETEFYVNAGGTSQPGVELALTTNLIDNGYGFFKHLDLRNAYTYSKYTFRDYHVNDADYSGNKLTGVPQNVLVSTLNAQLPRDFNLFIQHNYTSSIPLNDGNTVYARRYHLLQARLSWNKKIAGSLVYFFVSADNLLNEQYSLGNDLNAIGNRYFNPAPLRNYNAGINVSLQKGKLR